MAQTVAAAGALVAAGWGFAPSGRGANAQTAESERSLLLDNAKVCSLFFVIFGHVLYYNLSGEWHGQARCLSGADNSMKLLMGLISPLKLPIFCFVSGICSQGATTPGRLRRFFVFLVAPTLIWVLFAKPVIYDTLIDGSFSSFWGRFVQALTLNTFHEEWYLQALIFWRGSTYLIWNHLRPSVALCGMFALSLIGGYKTFSDGPAHTLKIDETLGFLPYFAVGFVFPYERALLLIQKPRPIGSFVVFLAVLAYTSWLSSVLGGQLPNGHGPYGAISDGDAWKAAAEGSLAHALYWVRRFAKVLLDLSAGLVFMLLVLPRGKTFLSWAGQHTLHPYVWHIMAMTWFDSILAKLPLPAVTSHLGHAAVLCLNALLCLAVLVLFSSKPWRSLWAWCFHPTWLHFIVESDKPSAAPSEPPLCVYVRETGPPVIKGRPLVPADGHLPAIPEISSSIASPRKDVARPAAGPEGAAGLGLGRPPSSQPVSPLQPAAWPEAGENAEPPEGGEAVAWKMAVELPSMMDSKAQFGKYVLPLFVFFLSFPLMYFFGLVGVAKVLEVLEHCPLWFMLPFFFIGFGYFVFRYIYHFRRLFHGCRPPPPLPEGREPLLHICMVVEYKEPLEVVMRTVESIARQSHIGRRPVLVVATEACDETRHDTCEALRNICGDMVEDFIMTEHTLQPGETAGKHSNENHAVREVYRRFVDEQGMSPFKVMLTIIDADAILSELYLAHLESTFAGMPDGRRFIYNGPLNTYRNMDEAGLIVTCMEVNRCHRDVFHDPFSSYHPQSNYSMTLGMAQEIGYWMPDCISEDLKSHVKAVAFNFGSQTTVSVPAFICNDLVSSVSDRYVQAKRHQWGSVEECCWHMKLAHDQPLNFRQWMAVFGDEFSRASSLVKVAGYLLGRVVLGICTYYLCVHRPDLLSNPRIVIPAILGVIVAICMWGAEVLLWSTCLRQFPIRWPGTCRLLLLVALTPILTELSNFLFYACATVHCIFHITFVSHDLAYVNAPKGSNAWSGAGVGQP